MHDNFQQGMGFHVLSMGFMVAQGSQKLPYTTGVSTYFRNMLKDFFHK